MYQHDCDVCCGFVQAKIVYLHFGVDFIVSLSRLGSPSLLISRQKYSPLSSTVREHVSRISFSVAKPWRGSREQAESVKELSLHN